VRVFTKYGTAGECVNNGGKDFTFYGYGRRSTRVHADTYGGRMKARYDITVTGSQPKTSKIENTNKNEEIARTRV